MQRVDIIATGVSNTASVLAAFQRLGCETRVVDTPDAIQEADFAVLPGVGAFAAGMDFLEQAGLVAALQRRITSGRPTLAVCLGMQLLTLGSAEAPGRTGLACVNASARKFAPGMRVPHMGWNTITPDPSCRILQPGDAYFAHSFYVPELPPDGAGWAVARAVHGTAAAPVEFVAAFERGAVVALQFHPELSGAFGEGILERWLSTEAIPC